ncbi:MAG: glycosyltransferase family 39 protein, partial [Thermodesulfobacteriota bacterium]|nr:glycosyltransferase family 39 protein [Thermodesulfobacteriota bacterium]
MVKENKYIDYLIIFLKVLLLSIALLYLFTYVFIVYNRIHYPYELEWMEGGSVDHVRRILSGDRLYVSPSLSFTPFIYTPLYFYISALVSLIFDIGFFPLRFVSLLSSLGCFIIIFLFVKRETGNMLCGVLSSCLLAATFRISGAWFDIARVDSLFLLFLLSGIYIIRFGHSMGTAITAGILMFLSFFTKQTALLISLPLMVYFFYENRRTSIIFIGTFISLVVISTLVFNWLHEGWYNYYIFDLPKQHSINKSKILTFWIVDIIKPLSIAFLMSFFTILFQFTKSKNNDFIFYLMLSIGMIGASWLSILHSGGYNNVLFPAYSAISIL